MASDRAPPRSPAIVSASATPRVRRARSSGRPRSQPAGRLVQLRSRLGSTTTLGDDRPVLDLGRRSSSASAMPRADDDPAPPGRRRSRRAARVAAADVRAMPIRRSPRRATGARIGSIRAPRRGCRPLWPPAVRSQHLRRRRALRRGARRSAVTAPPRRRAAAWADVDRRRTRAPTSSCRLCGTGSGSPSPRSPLSRPMRTRATSSAKKGLPPRRFRSAPAPAAGTGRPTLVGSCGAVPPARADRARVDPARPARAHDRARWRHPRIVASACHEQFEARGQRDWQTNSIARSDARSSHWASSSATTTGCSTTSALSTLRARSRSCAGQRASSPPAATAPLLAPAAAVAAARH